MELRALARFPPQFPFSVPAPVDLPTPPVRQSIFEIHLSRRKQAPKSFDLGKLASATEGFSGAEIEESVVAGLFSAFAANTPLSTEVMLAEISNTRPLARTMVEKIDELRSWARDRTVMAD